MHVEPELRWTGPASPWHNSSMRSQRPPSSARSLATGLIAGAAASLCCLGPAAAALLGLGASSTLAGVQLGAVPAAALGLGLLALGIALAVRRGARCELGPAQRLRAPLLMIAVFALSYAALGVGLPRLAAQQIAAAPTAAQTNLSAPAGTAQGRRMALSIEKMDCLPCVAQVRRLLAEQPGVLAFTAELSLDLVTVDYRPESVDAQALVALMPRSYGVTLLDDAALP